MSADFRAGNLTGYGHLDQDPPYIHVVFTDPGGPFPGEAPLGNFDLADLGNLVRLAGQAWPGLVEVRYVIEHRRPGGDWRPGWSALAAESDSGGVSEEFAAVTLEEFRKTGELEWRLARRTLLAADEILDGDAS